MNNIHLGTNAGSNVFESKIYNNSYFIASTSKDATLNLIKELTKTKQKEQVIVESDEQIRVSPVSFVLHLNNSQSKNGKQSVADISSTSKTFGMNPIIVSGDGAIQLRDYSDVPYIITIGSLNDSASIRARCFIKSRVELVGCKRTRFNVFTPCNAIRLGM